MRMAIPLAGRLCVDMQSASAGGLAIAEAPDPCPKILPKTPTVQLT